ncbi:MAG: SMP-30/gluconolactonase/LRE family protein, partial [FCB group bacterium]|nr:SMP-30/gluconolactonase/LRE family protein [FCB group bacterium]
IKTDRQGRLWCTSDVGVRVFSPEGQALGVVETPQPPANCAFGEKDARTLFITARTGVYKVAVAK